MRLRSWLVGVVIALLALVVVGLAYPMISGLERDAVSLVARAFAEERGHQEPPAVDPEKVRLSEDAQWNLARLGVRGTVTSVSDAQVVVETADGERATVLLSEETRFWVPGEPVTKTITLSVGDPLLAFGKPAREVEDTEEKTLDSLLLVVVIDEDLPRMLIRGRVVATARQVLVVQAARGERAITVLPRTHILSPIGGLKSLRGIRRGDLVIALGQPTEMGQWMAGLVLVSGPGRQIRPGLRGEVLQLDPDAGTLTVGTRQGDEVEVFTSADTRYRIPEITTPVLADIQEGDRIDVVGRFDKEGGTKVEALAIRVLLSVGKEKQP